MDERPASVLFGSKYGEHKFVLEGARPVRDAFGNATGVLSPGREIQFKDHLFRTSDPAEIAFLSSKLGTEIILVEDAGTEDELRERTVATIGAASTASVVEKTNQPVRCDHCGRSFKHLGALTLHMQHVRREAEHSAAAAEGARVGGERE